MDDCSHSVFIPMFRGMDQKCQRKTEKPCGNWHPYVEQNHYIWRLPGFILIQFFGYDKKFQIHIDGKRGQFFLPIVGE